MNDRMNNIYTRLINFFSKHEKEEVSFDQLAKEFSFEEIKDFSRFFYTPLFHLYIRPMAKPKEFTDFVERTLLEDDVLEIERDPLLYLVSEDFLLEKIEAGDIEKYQYFGNDIVRQKALALENIRKNERIFVECITYLDDDRLKLKYLKKLFIGDRTEILSSIKDEKLKEELIPKYFSSADILICNLLNEDMRIYYYEKYFRKLSSIAKGKIFATFSEENKIKYLERYWKKFSKKEKAMHLASIKKNDLILEKSKEIDDDIDLIYLIAELSDNHNQEMAFELAKRITYNNKKTLKKILKRIPTDSLIYLDLERLFSGYSEKQKMHYLTQEVGYAYKPYIAAILKDFKAIEKFMSHRDDLGKYDPRYNLLIHKYAMHYSLNEEHLTILLKITGMELLKILKNDSIREIINFDEKNFNRIVRIFDSKSHQLDNATINDNINILLQRTFKQNFPDIININPRIKFAIQQGDKKQAIELINGIMDEFDVIKILKKHSLTREKLLEEIFKSDSPESIAMKCLHDITNAYIVYKRNQYIKENIDTYRQRVSMTRLEKKSTLKYVVETFPSKLIIESFFSRPTYSHDIQKYTKLELELLEKNDVIEQIIDFRRNPQKYEVMPENVKKYMSAFNKIFEKNFSGNLFFIPPSGTVRAIYEPHCVEDENESIDILLMLDPELLKRMLSNDEQYKCLISVLEGYKVMGWDAELKAEFFKSDITVDSYTIGFLIKYFSVIYNDLQNKVEKGELKSITLTALLDLAQCYGVDTSKRSLVFGSDNVRLLSSNPGPNNAYGKKEDRLKKAEELLPKIIARKTVAVPTCDRNFELESGKKINIVVGNFSNPMNLTYGERTGSCMRIEGAGETLFDFCLENEHGFHIRFSNPENDKFVSRVSGFRNGNTVFLNELRFSVDCNYSDKEIEEACTLIAQTLIEESKDSQNPIQNVVIAPTYVMKGKPTISLEVGNIQEGIGSFYRDIQSQKAVVLATSNPDNSLVPVRLNNKGIPRYTVQRDKVKYYEGQHAINQMSRIELLNQLLAGKKLEDAEVTEKKDITFCYSGEDWYIAVDKQGNITEYVMENSNKKEIANREKRECLKQIKLQLGLTYPNNEATNINSAGGAKK